MTTHSSLVGRLAPSPTGLLHLGNAWAFLLAWLACRKEKGTLLLRLEDIDTTRSRPEFRDAVLEDLAWLGLTWDEGPFVQSARGEVYAAYLRRLAPHLYPCFCTRKELRCMASAPNGCDETPVYPGTCRNLSESARAERKAMGKQASLRLACPETPISFTDRVYGPMCFHPREFGGDFAVRRSDGVIAYQLAVAVDDGCMGVTQVVRGRDILPSTAKQLLLQTFLGLPHPQEYAHVPLLLDPLGERLAKRHQSLSLRALRLRGIPPTRIVGALAHLAGINPWGKACTPAELLPAFSYECLPREDIVVDAEAIFFT